MWNKKSFGTCLLCALTAVALILPASAHGYGHRGGHNGVQRQVVQSTAVAVCPVEGCAIAGRHSHGGTAYCGYAHESGLCDGNCRALCPVEDRTTVGRHNHGDTAYCGYSHESGFCDGNCRALCPVEGRATGQLGRNGTAYRGRHHHGYGCAA